MIGITLLALYNAIGAALGKDIRPTVALYWFSVTVYWISRAG